MDTHAIPPPLDLVLHPRAPTPHRLSTVPAPLCPPYPCRSAARNGSSTAPVVHVAFHPAHSRHRHGHAVRGAFGGPGRGEHSSSCHMGYIHRLLQNRDWEFRRGTFRGSVQHWGEQPVQATLRGHPRLHRCGTPRPRSLRSVARAYCDRRARPAALQMLHQRFCARGAGCGHYH